MAFQKKLPMSAALRPDKPSASGGGDPFKLGSLKGPSSGPNTTPGKKPPTTIGKGVSMPKQPKMPTMPSMPKSATSSKPPSYPKAPKYK